ncbi:MAG: aminoglycoside phosphotransferase family protein [Bacteroidetes bacterium]|nr:MAG: aminoglycoside phosphotransferase family protein [Bacteroidota bacterium]
MISEVLNEYGLNSAALNVTPFGTGLINHTWKIHLNGDANSFILQKINCKIFRKPEDIAHNTRLIGEYLHKNFPNYLYVRPLLSKSGADIVHIKDKGFFRLVPFVENSHTIDVVQSPGQAYEAARQFGKFTKLLNGFDVSQLRITIPDFHNLPLRYSQFLDAIKQGNPSRIEDSKEMIQWLVEHDFLVKRFGAMEQSSGFKKRVTHHDAKISNVLFNENNQGLCVIDLDTVMPGYFISDVGDMFRTYLSPVSEEESDFTKVEVRDEYYHAICEGYLSEMREELSADEKSGFFDGGCYLIYMQALRFITDHLQDDAYYGAHYANQNFVRAGNQMILLQKLLSKESEMRSSH